MILLIAAVLGAGFYLGTQHKTSKGVEVAFQDSGMAEALSSNLPYQAAAEGRDVILRGGTGGRGGGVYRVQMEKEVSLKCEAETRHGFTLALRREIERIIRAKGATMTGDGSDTYGGRRFEYAYHWGANEGIIHGYLVDDAKESRLIMLLYEHRR